MKIIMLLVILTAFATPLQANEELEQLLKTANTLLRENNTNDYSAARRLFIAILDKDPKHPEALWKLLFIDHLYNITNSSKLLNRARHLAAVGPTVNSIIENARERNQPAFAYYVLARYTGLYKAYDRSLEAIEKAVSLKPDSIKYLYYLGDIQASKGIWEKQDALIIQGIKTIEQVQKRNHPDSEFSYNDADFYFKQARLNSQLTTPNHEKTVEFYQAVIKLNPESKTDRAYSWNNISIAYRSLGQCQKAKHAAEQALEIMTFGAAKSNLQDAEFCLEMDKLTEGFKLAKVVNQQ